MSGKLCHRLEIRPGVTAVIGSGGKTGLIEKLCEELSGTVVICTTTHIFPSKTVPFRHDFDPFGPKKVCIGRETEGKKLVSPDRSIKELAQMADYVLVEADGSRGLPLKAHLEHEPVIPDCANQVIQVVGLSGLGRPICRAAHRPERYAELCGVRPEDIATPERVAKVLNTEALADRYVLNQADDLEEHKWGLTVAALLKQPTAIISLLTGYK